jgi:signal transduction histidine kinase
MASQRKIWHSLSGKLLLLFLAMAVVFVMLVGAGIRHAFQDHFRENVRPHITQYLEYVQNDIGTPPDRQRAQVLADKLNLEVQIIDNNGHWSSSGTLVRLDELQIERRFAANGKQLLHAEDDRRHYLMVRDGEATLLFNVPNVRDQRRGFRGWMPLLILLAVLLLLYHATRRLIAPLNTIQQGVQKFGSGEIDHRIDIRRKDELGELAISFNAMAEEIKQMLDAKRQLLLAISHELRSPLTRARLAVEMLDDNDKKRQLTQDIREMESLIEELIEAERLSSRHAMLNRSIHDITGLISDVLATHFEESGIKLNGVDTAVRIDVDAARIKLLLKNLLDNAIRHTPDDAPRPELAMKVEDDKLCITVADHGEGIDEKHLPHLTEPFYRVDPSRQRETGGYGLGLYLCRMIARAHGGALQISSVIGHGTTVKIELPR